MKKHKRPRTISSSIRLNKMKHKAIWLHGSNCLKCGSDKRLELDHIKPTSYYPELIHRFTNVQILCKDCNIRKSNSIEETNDYRLDINKTENYNKDELDKLNTYYGKFVNSNPITNNRYLRRLLR